MATVSSVLCESTTMISSAHDTDASAAPMCAASSRVMTVTVSFTRCSLSQRPFPFPFPFSLLPFPFSLFPLPTRRHRLYCLEAHERAVVGDDRVQLGQSCIREV